MLGVFIDFHVYTCMYVCVRVCGYVYVYIYIHVYMYTHTHICSQNIKFLGCVDLSTHNLLPVSFLSVTAIYNIVSQRQMSGRSDSDFSPASNVVPITVEPTQNSTNKGMCCQTN